MALRPGSGGGGSFIYPVGGGMGPPQGMMPMQQTQQQQAFPGMVQMQPNMTGMIGMNFPGQIPPVAMPMQGGMAMGMQAPGMQFIGQPQFMGMRAPGPHYTADMQKQMAEEHQRRLEQQQRMLEEDRKRRQFEEQKQKLRLLSSVKPKGPTGASRDDALEAIKGNLDGFSRDAKMHPTPSSHPKKPGVGGYPQQEHIQPMVPGWLYNDSLIPEMFKKVLEFTMTPGGIDTAKLYPILMSSGLPREALGQIWASANRTTPGMLTKEELYTVLALIGVAQSGLPAMNVEILSQFPSPPVPNLPALAMALASVMPQQPLMNQPPVSMAMSVPAPAVMGIAPLPSNQPPAANFITNFPPVQATKADDDDFQDFQEAPKAGGGDQSFTEFQGESGASSFPTTKTSQHQNSVSAMLTPVSGSSTSDKYAVFKQLSVDQPPEPTQPAADFGGDKYSVFRQLEPTGDRKPVGEGFADFKSVSVDDGFTDFKTADSISPLDPPDQAKMFQPAFPPAFPNSQSLPQLQPPQHQQTQHQPAVSLPQPKPSLNMSDLGLFSMVPPAPGRAPSETKPSPFPSVPPSLLLPAGGAKPPGGGADDFGDFALFGSSEAASIGPAVGGGLAAVSQDDFADFMAFGSSAGEAKGEDVRSGERSAGVRGEPGAASHLPLQGSDKYSAFKQLSLEGGLAYDDNKQSTRGSFSSLKSEADDFADFQSSKFCPSLGGLEKSLVDNVAGFKQGGKEDCASVKSLDLPSIGGSSVGKEDSEDALSVQLDMKLSDMGGALKHVMSDSSLDLTGQQPPAAGEELVRLLW